MAGLQNLCRQILMLSGRQRNNIHTYWKKGEWHCYYMLTVRGKIFELLI